MINAKFIMHKAQLNRRSIVSSPSKIDQWCKPNAEDQACLTYAEVQPIDAERAGRGSMITKGFIISCLLLVALTACDRSHDGKLDEFFETQVVDIVTYTGLDDDNHATFRLDGRDDEPAVTLFSTVGAPNKVKENERLLLTYSIDHRASDNSYWNINAVGFSRIINDSLRVNANPLDTYQMRPIKLISAWRTGEFINLHGQAEATSKSRLLYMMIDSETKYNETVDAYLVHDLLGTPSDSIFQWREFYMSINVAALKSPSAPCHTLRLHLNDEANHKITYRDFHIK